MLASILFLILGSVIGFILLRISKSPLQIEEQVIWGIPIGITVLTVWTFLLALIIKSQNIAIACSIISAFLFIVGYYFFSKPAKDMMLEIRNAKDRFGKKEKIAWSLVLVPWLLYTALVIPNMLFLENGHLMAGWMNVWADWSAHLRTSTFFTSQDILSLEHPLYSSIPHHYPYISNYLSAILQKLFLPVHLSLTWPTVVMFATLPVILYIFGYKVTESKKAGIIFTYLFLFAGGLGAYYLFKDFLNLTFFWNIDLYHPTVYTHLMNINENPNKGIWFMNFIISEFLPQRAFLAGFPIALYVIYAFWKRNNRQSLIFAGILFGILPLIHTHSFIALGLIIPTMALWLIFSTYFKNKRWSEIKPLLISFLHIILPATIIGFTVFFTFLFDFRDSGSFLKIIQWWMPEQGLPRDNPIWYWIRNTGLLIPLAILSFFLIKKEFKAFILSGLVLFVFSNVLQLQPNLFDNLKILTYWYLLWLIPISLVLTRLSRKYIVSTFLIIIIMTSAGFADTMSVYLYSQRGAGLANSEEIEFANQVKKFTESDPDGIILIYPNNNHPISLLSGRRIYIGYNGWLWSYGIDYSERMKEVDDIYSTSKLGENLIKEKEIKYIVLGPHERNRYGSLLDESKLKELYPPVVSTTNYLLLKVPE